MSPITKRSPLFSAFVRTRQLGIAWMIAVVLGAILISANSAIRPERLFLPVAVMITYGLFIYNRSAGLFAGSSEAFQQTIVGQLADSIYFMGFVWTLWALIDSFVFHGLNQASAVFRTFGYALFTTAFGMFGRLVILQFKYTATEQSGGAQATVEQALLEFGSTLELTRGALAQWQSTLRTANDQVTAASSTLHTTIETTGHELTTTITEATTTYATMIRTTQTSLEGLITKLGTDLTSTLKKAVEDAVGDFGTTTVQQFDEIKSAAAGTATALKRVNTGLGKSIDDLTINANNAAIQLGSATLAITSAEGHAGDAIKRVTTTLESAVSDFTLTMKTNSETLTRATTTLAQDLTGLADQIRKDITLGLAGITITPHVGLAVDETVIHNALAPLQRDVQENRDETKRVQATLEKIPTTPATPGDVRNASERLQGLMATITGKLEHIDAKMHEPRGWWPFGRG